MVCVLHVPSTIDNKSAVYLLSHISSNLLLCAYFDQDKMFQFEVQLSYSPIKHLCVLYEDFFCRS